MNIKQAIEYGYMELSQITLDGMLKSKMILAFVLEKPREYLVSHDIQELTKHQEKQFIDYIDKIKDGLPIQYITHTQFFREYKFYVDENVLIPQPDTEILVDEAIKLIDKISDELIEKNRVINKNNNDKYDKLNILDMCTGSGAIVVSLAKERPHNDYMATDISVEAIKIANKNAVDNGAENIKFLQGDLFDAIAQKEEREELDYENYLSFLKEIEKGNADKDKKATVKEVPKPNPDEFMFDLIVSNPPYIESNTISKLSKEVQREPTIALDGGIDGLDFYRRIAQDAKRFLKSNGYVLVEIGFNQREIVEAIFKSVNYNNVHTVQDLAGNDRVVIAQYRSE